MPPPLSQHVAQFYEDDEFLTESLVSFVKAGLQNNEMVIIVATAPRVHTLRQALTPDDLSNTGLSFFDAAALLSYFMVDDWPNHALFMAVLGQHLQEAGRKRRVRVYGEMVAVLWSNGQYQAALCLEGLWNTLQTTQPFDLLHAYPHQSHSVTSEIDSATWLAVYQAHSHVCHQHSDSSN